MRHEQVKLRDSYDIVDIAAAWPRPDGGMQAAIGELDRRATPAVPDVPPAVGRMIVAVYAALIGIFALTMARSDAAAFMISVSGLYVLVFLAVPRIFLALEGDTSRRPDLARFLERGIDTWSGHMSGRSALVQILIVPVLLAVAVSAMGVAALWILP